jgi:hypothetical protein
MNVAQLADGTVATATNDAAKKMGFRFETEELKDRDGKVIDTIEYVVVTDVYTRSWLRNADRDGVWYQDAPRAPVQSLFRHIVSMRQYAETTKRDRDFDSLRRLLAELEKRFADTQATIDAMIADGAITFDFLWYVFQKGQKIVGPHRDTLVGGEVEIAEYGTSWFGRYFSIIITVVDTNGSKFIHRKHDFRISWFKGTVRFDELPVRPLSDADRETLTKRGRIFRDVAIGANYLHYSGHLIRKNWWSTQTFRAEGRVMVDLNSMKRIDDQYFRDRSYFDDDDSSGDPFEELPDSQLWRTWPFVHGFSFACKKWGEMRVEHLRPIEFNDAAFDTLVLDPDKKSLILALVQNAGRTFTDVIEGKGGGCIFLLHGTPGTGKTLTAEAVAEMLHRPLYSVSVGELGTRPDELEDRLRQILDMAQIWNAVVLLDEADIFLEARDEHDITRNAMVGVFLRLLEYHQGVMFLTTNRVRNFDQAFHSRISIALKYPPLDESHREAVWRNLLSAAGVTGLDPKALARFEINGRQIKTTVRLAQSLAKSEGKPVDASHIERTVLVAKQFQEDLAA